MGNFFQLSMIFQIIAEMGLEMAISGPRRLQQNQNSCTQWLALWAAFSSPRGPQGQVFVLGVEVKATLQDLLLGT